ncbi:hypothetical protein ABZ488_04675 [Streptomyces griseus]|uniref:hypothetical protein n=1 Tax=Streptomyces griseus TaxID=1911 RepID=UPI0033F782B1
MTDTTPTPADRPTDQLRAAADRAPSPELARLLATLADASDHHPTGEGGAVATVVHPALAVARQLLGTNAAEGAEETHVVTDDSDDPEHTDDCPGCEPAPAASADQLRDRLRAAAQRALESLDNLIADHQDPGAEALGARYELARELSNTSPEVARRILGTSAAEGATAVPSADRRARYAAAIREADGWVLHDGQHMIDAVMAVADAEQASLRAEAEGLDEALRGAISASEKDGARLRAELAAAPLAEVWTVWRENEPIHGHYATVDDARQGTIDYWQNDKPVCPDYSWRQDGPRLELVVGGVHGGVYASRHRVYGAPPAPADRAALTDAERQFLTFAMDLAFDEMVSNDGFTDEDHAALDKFRALATPPAAPAAPEEQAR